MKVGDKIITIEKFGDLHFEWESTITQIASNYIETEFIRDHNNQTLLNLCQKLAPNHRAFLKQTVKNYFYNQQINIKPL